MNTARGPKLVSILALTVAAVACGASTETGTTSTGTGTNTGIGGHSSSGGPGGSGGSANNVDKDQDGYTIADGDCDDNDPLVHPNAPEKCGNGKDDNCDGHIDESVDKDGDGYGSCSGDCNDADPAVHPGAKEIAGDGIDNNCDGIIDGDFDGDGYTVEMGDCDDTNPAVHPGAKENCFNGVDDDCNGHIDADEPDADGDGFGPCQGDCDDTNPLVYPGAPEIPGDGVDNNCDNLVDADLDGDGWTVKNGDCDDNNAAVNPGVYEICGNGIDDDCNGVIDTDCLTKCDLAALTRSSVGCRFFAIDTNPMHSFIAGDYAVVVSNIDPTLSANVVIEVKNGGTWSPVAGGTFSVGPLNLQTTVLPHRFIDNSALYAGGAYRITSDLPVIAYQFNPINADGSFLSDAALLLPTSSLDKYYIVPAWPYGPADASNSGWPAHIQIAASAATQVRVVSPITTVASNGIASLTPNVQSAFNLDEGDYLQLTVANYMDSFNGTYIESDAPVAVFTSNDCANVPASASYCCCEHLEEQVFGLQAWGTHYVGGRTHHATDSSNEPAVWQVMAQQDNTVVNFAFNPEVTGLPTSVTLNARQMAQYTVSGTAANPGDFYVSADKPVLVTQYMVASAMVDGSNGDPSMMLTVPVEQYLDHYVVLVPTSWDRDYLTLIRPVGATVSIDGVPLTSGWTAVGGAAFEVARPLVADGVHVLQGTAPFGVIVVGYDPYNSYGYPGGMNQKVINPMN